jgi:hypothetical protein
LNFRASTARQAVLQPCVQGNGPPPPGPLPSLGTLKAEFRNPMPGTVLLSLVRRCAMRTRRLFTLFYFCFSPERDGSIINPIADTWTQCWPKALWIWSTRRQRLPKGKGFRLKAFVNELILFIYQLFSREACLILIPFLLYLSHQSHDSTNDSINYAFSSTSTGLRVLYFTTKND